MSHTGKKGGPRCPISNRDQIKQKGPNRAAESLSDARFRPQTVRDETKVIPRKRKHDEDIDERD